MYRRIARLRPLLLPAGIVLCLAMLLLSTVATTRLSAVVQALQFVIFAVAAPALVAIAWPPQLSGASGLMRLRRKPAIAALMALLPYLALVVIWRIPAVVSAQAGSAGYTILEMVTLVSAGTTLWLALTGAVWADDPLPRPLRAGMAAIAMWTIWVIAYITGMSVSGQTLGQADADSRELSVAVMWAVAAICYAPVVYVMLMSWLGRRPDAGQLAGQPSRDPMWPEANGSLRPPRGWSR